MHRLWPGYQNLDPRISQMLDEPVPLPGSYYVILIYIEESAFGWFRGQLDLLQIG